MLTLYVYLKYHSLLKMSNYLSGFLTPWSVDFADIDTLNRTVCKKGVLKGLGSFIKTFPKTQSNSFWFIMVSTCH